MRDTATNAGIFTIKESATFIWGGVFWLLFALLLRFVLIPWQIADEIPQSGTSARYIPTAIAYLLMVFGLALGYNGFRMRNAENQRAYVFNLPNMRLVLYSLLIVSANIIAFDLFGYIIPAVCTLAVLMLLYGNRNYLKIAIISLCLPFVIDKFFRMALQMYLP